MLRSCAGTIAILAIACSMLAPAPTLAQTACVPNVAGVPGQSGPPPFWQTPGGDASTTGVDDPRWRGAYAQAFGGDGLRIRALTYRDGTQDYLLVSWDVRVDGGPQLTAGDRISLALYDDTGTAGAKPLRIELSPTLQSNLSTAGSETLLGGPAALDVDVYTGTVASGAVTWAASPIASVPAWVADLRYEGDYLRSGSPPVTRRDGWRVQARIPIGGSEVPINPAAAFRFYSWVSLELAGGLTTTHRWPATATGNPFPALSSWGSARLGTGASDCRLGVSIESASIGTTNPSPHQIRVPGSTGATSVDNVFYARPINHDVASLDGASLTASFRLANWGSFVGDSPRWEPVPGCDAAPGAAGAVAVGGNANIQCTWAAGVRERCIYVDPSDARCATLTPPVTASDRRHPHQCVLATLTSSDASVTFSRDSAYRNMDFVSASEFTRVATIDVGEGPADVYLIVGTHHMPAPSERRLEAMSLEHIRGLAARLGREHAEASPSSVFDALTARGVPTYETYVFRGSGPAGAAGVAVEPMPSFGFLVGHEGTLHGWLHTIEGAEQLGPNVWVVHVPESGVINVRTVIVAAEASPAALPALGDVPQPPCFESDCDPCTLDPTGPTCRPEAPSDDAPPDDHDDQWMSWLRWAAVLLALLLLIVLGTRWLKRKR